MMFEVGERVHVRFPTGSVRRDDPFVVIECPEDRSPNLTWVKYDGPYDPLRSWTKKDAPMGFYWESLEAAS